MRLTLHLRGIDLVDVEFTAGSKGLLLDVDWFKPVSTEPEREEPMGTVASHVELGPVPEFGEDQASWVFGFSR